MPKETRETHTPIRLTQQETEALNFIIQTLHINSSEAMRRSITYFAFNLASKLPVSEIDSCNLSMEAEV